MRELIYIRLCDEVGDELADDIMSIYDNCIEFCVLCIKAYNSNPESLFDCISDKI